MATLCNIFLFTAIGLSFLAGQVSYGHKLFNVSLIEGERQGCPNTNCAGKVNCKNDAECPGSKCCIDAVTTMACCYQPGDPTHAPTTTDPQNSALAPSLPPPCGNLVQNEACKTPPDGPCLCTTNADCYPNEICCIEVGPPIAAKCYEVAPPPTTAAPTTTQAPTAKCPSTISNPVCIPGLTTNSDGATCAAASDCRITEVCCRPYRGMPSCCVALPL